MSIHRRPFLKTALAVPFIATLADWLTIDSDTHAASPSARTDY